MRLIGFLLAAVLLPGGVTRAAAPTVVYDNGGPDGRSGAEMSNYVRADDFSLGSTSTFNQIRFWDDELPSEPPGYTGHGFTWWIFSTSPDPGHTSGQMPGSILYTGTATPTREDQGLALGAPATERYQNDLFIQSLTLAPGTYWLGLNEGTNFPYDYIYWETTSPGVTPYSYYSQGGTNNWQYESGSFAFELLDSTAVPEPGSMAFVAMGMIGVFGVTRRRTFDGGAEGGRSRWERA